MSLSQSFDKSKVESKSTHKRNKNEHNRFHEAKNRLMSAKLPTNEMFIGEETQNRKGDQDLQYHCSVPYLKPA
jgi:hypothetical protein